MFRTALRVLLAVAVLAPSPALTQQAVDEEYTRLIKEHLQDERISTELVDHLPASETVPTPLDFHGRIVGTPGELTYAADIHRYLRAIADATPRARVWSIGQTEEGREMIVMAIADEATIADLDRYKEMLNELTDPRSTTEERAREIIGGDGKPIYWLTSGMHSPENGGPEMLQELAYRLVVDEGDRIRRIRQNIITFITPVIEVDGREKQVDTYYFNKDRPEGEARLPLMYWGKYVAHDNNRDGMGQFLALTKNVNRLWLEWTPTVMHDLHEAQSYLYSSTGTGPYNESFDPITIGEWWVLAQNDVLEMTKRGVPGVWTYNFYDGWTPNYMFTIAHAHNGIGRFYEVQSYGPDNRDSLRLGATTTSREWFRPNPPLPEIAWGPRNNTNIQQSAVLFSLEYTADHRDWFLENYWLKGKRSIQKGKEGPVYGWHIPAEQRRRADAVDAVNELLRQGLEIHRADRAFELDGTRVQAGDFIARADQPYRTLADMYFGLQQFSLANPRPYDDTGWTLQLMRNVDIDEVKDAALLEQPMTPVTYPARAPGGISGRGNVIVVDHTTDNNLMAFRFRHADVRMLAAEEDFELNDHRFRAGAFILPQADRAAVEASLTELGLSAWATGSVPDVPTHELDVPRIGYVHSWQRTQDEGWVRAALDTYGVPYTYFADQELREGNLRARYDVIVFPHVGGDAQSQVNGIAMTGELPLPYRQTEATPNLGVLDESDDIRGGMGFEGLFELAKFVREGGTLIVEGSTSTIFPSYGLTSGVTVEEPDGLIAPGSIHRGVFADASSPIAYGYTGDQLPVYFKNDVVLATGGGLGRLARAFGAGGRSPWQNTTPMANKPPLSPWEADTTIARGEDGAEDAEAAEFRRMARQFGFGGDEDGPRVVMKFPDQADRMLLSGALGGGQALQGRAQVLDAPVGEGHVVMFAIRPFWRWQTQGTFFLGFNAILNWNDLDAGKVEEEAVTDAPNGRER
ncbi:MAG TPA: M14 family zinc carboxypeptidase [Longimicrobiales bacterium]|nr:M14 family zinc carboxypeptidase [Longimicrobiales bacterium]